MANLERKKRNSREINNTPISNSEDSVPARTVKISGKYHHILKVETAMNGGNVKEIVNQAVKEYIEKYLPEKL